MSNREPAVPMAKSKRVPRIDGPLKVTGQAKYTSDMNPERVVYAVPVGATIAKGTVTAIDDSPARKMKGVLEVFTKKNIGPLYRVAPDDGFTSRIDESRPPFEDNIIRYYGQYVALVVAETFEIAQAAARAVRVTYQKEKHNVDLDLKQEDLKKVETERGDAVGAFAKAQVQVDHTYVTPLEYHNPIEMHATVADWKTDLNGEPQLLLYETSQAIFVHQNVIAQVLGIPKDSVRVITKFLGSGFGGKLWLWPHSTLAAASARILKRPVKLVIDRKMMFTNVGHRPRTQQTVKLGADKDGKLLSVQHHYATQTSIEGDYVENCGEVSALLYGVENVKVTSGVARRNQGVPTAMRGPGAVPGLFALESAMDELAIRLKIDPVKLRLANDTMTDGKRGKPFSSRHLKECLEVAATRFGWEKRNPEIGSMKDGAEILGWGMSACTWPARTLDAEAIIDLQRDGKVRVLCSAQDIGTGTYQVLAQITSDELQVPLAKIEVVLGDTQGPPGPLSGGSMATGSIVPVIIEAAAAAKKKLLAIATKMPASPFFGQDAKSLKYADGKVSSEKTSAVEFGSLINKLNVVVVSGKGSVKGNFAVKDKPTSHAFGAQFVEIGWRPELARLRVRRVVTVMDAGRIINYQPAKNQVEGGIVMGVGMALFEKGELDRNFGQPINSNLADYIVSSHADVPEIDVSFVDYPDKAMNAYGARGVGEIGLAGVAPAICAAVYHATGIRIRNLPVTIEDLLRGQGAQSASVV